MCDEEAIFHSNLFHVKVHDFFVRKFDTNFQLNFAANSVVILSLIFHHFLYFFSCSQQISKRISEYFLLYISLALYFLYTIVLIPNIKFFLGGGDNILNPLFPTVYF